MTFFLDHDTPHDLTYSLRALGHEVVMLRDVLPARTMPISFLLLIALGLWTSLFPVHADVVDPDKGHIGSALVRARDSDFLTVEYVAAQSPAAEAGLKKGDGITAINGIPAQDMSPTEARNLVEGDIGGVVKLTVRRAGSAEEQIAIVRRSLLDAYLPAATAGDPRAQFSVGYFYEHVPIPKQDLAQAAKWYGQAAEQNFAPAQAYFGYMQQRGLGMPKDQNAAITWLRKGAKQGDSFAERELALSYLNGNGVHQNDSDAFAWFYSAAKQDDPTAEQYLGFLYRTGRGVQRDNQAAFDWYYRSAERGYAYGEWGLAYMYEHGWGVKQNDGEALKWYQKAQAGLPPGESKKIEKIVVLLGLRAFLRNPDSTSFDLSLLMGIFRWQIISLFLFLTAVYLAGGLVLFYFSLRAPGVAPKLPVALGWMAFYLESQGVAMLGLCLLGATITAASLIGVTALLCALPVIASTCGPGRRRIWKASPASWKTLLFHVVSAFLAMGLIGVGYEKIYALVLHSPLPAQPTLALISKAKHASAWLAYATVVLVLPMAEEIIFRNYFFDALRRRFSGGTVVILTAFAFSLIHFQLPYFVPLFGVGLVLGWVRLKTDSLRLPVLLHAFNNGLALVFAG